MAAGVCLFVFFFVENVNILMARAITSLNKYANYIFELIRNIRLSPNPLEMNTWWVRLSVPERRMSENSESKWEWDWGRDSIKPFTHLMVILFLVFWPHRRERADNKLLCARGCEGSYYDFIFYFPSTSVLMSNDKHVKEKTNKTCAECSRSSAPLCVLRIEHIPMTKNIIKNPFGHFSYLSDCVWQVRIIKCVDIYVDGTNRTTAIFISHLRHESGPVHLTT